MASFEDIDVIEALVVCITLTKEGHVCAHCVQHAAQYIVLLFHSLEKPRCVRANWEREHAGCRERAGSLARPHVGEVVGAAVREVELIDADRGRCFVLRRCRRGVRDVSHTEPHNTAECVM